MSDRADEARAESERQWPELSHLTQAERAAWKAGGRWADANPQPHTITWKALAWALAGENIGNLRSSHYQRVLHRLGIEVTDDE